MASRFEDMRVSRITVEQYFMGRDKRYAAELTPQIRQNAVELLAKVNELLDQAAADGVAPGIDATTQTAVGSGWRPSGVNDKTANAAKASTHLTAQGIDLRDTKDRDLARWCLRNLDVLKRLGLYAEDPRWTPSWVHLQNRAPRSGRLVFIPSTKPPLAKPLPEQET